MPIVSDPAALLAPRRVHVAHPILALDAAAAAAAAAPPSASTAPVQVYALVARGKTVLAEFTSTSGNFPTVTRVLLAKIPAEDSKMSYVYDK